MRWQRESCDIALKTSVFMKCQDSNHLKLILIDPNPFQIMAHAAEENRGYYTVKHTEKNQGFKQSLKHEMFRME